MSTEIEASGRPNGTSEAFSWGDHRAATSDLHADATVLEASSFSSDFESIKAQLRANPGFTCKHLGRWNLSAAERVELARVLATEHPELAAKHFKRFQISDDKAKLDVATLLIPACAPQFKFFSPELTKFARWCKLRKWLKNVSLEESSGVELANRFLEQTANGECAAMLAKVLHVTSPEKRSQIAERVEEERPYEAIDALRILGLASHERLRETSIRLTETQPQAVYYALKFLRRVLEPHEMLDVLKALAATDQGENMCRHIESYAKNLEEQAAIAEVLAEKHPRAWMDEAIRHWPSHYKSWDISDTATLLRLVSIALERTLWQSLINCASWKTFRKKL